MDLNELVVLSPTFASVFSLTQSGIITARMSSWIVIPRSCDSEIRILKFSSRNESMNFAILTSAERESELLEQFI